MGPIGILGGLSKSTEHPSTPYWALLVVFATSAFHQPVRHWRMLGFPASSRRASGSGPNLDASVKESI